MKSLTNILTVGLLALSVSVFGQAHSLRLTTTVGSGSQTQEKAVAFILATNQVEQGANTRYVAGRSVTLEPGFQASTGAVFEAKIEAVRRSIESLELLVKAYPNPFTDNLTIEYSLPEKSKISLGVYDVSGRLVKQLIDNEELPAGTHQHTWERPEITPGGYLYSLQTEKETKTQRIVKTAN